MQYSTQYSLFIDSAASIRVKVPSCRSRKKEVQIVSVPGTFFSPSNFFFVRLRKVASSKNNVVVSTVTQVVVQRSAFGWWVLDSWTAGSEQFGWGAVQGVQSAAEGCRQSEV